MAAFGSGAVDEYLSGLTLQPAGLDEPFLRQLFKTTRAEQFGALTLPPAALDQLLDQQIRIQASAYAAQFPNATSLLIERDGSPVGRVLLNCDDGRWHIVDIAVLPSQRGHGAGTWAIERIAVNASEHGARRLTLTVLATNHPARRLYARLGFADIDVGVSHVVMSRRL